MRYLGITFDFGDYHYIADALEDHAKYFNKKSSMYLLDDIGLLESFFKFIDRTTFSRVILYDFKELGSWENFKYFSRLCRSYNLEFSILKQDIHSDVAIEVDYLLNVI
ncbi:hypothetical protein KGR20_21860 [Cytobacillus oceanisediminis]|nr:MULTISPECIES: hypothetical protein [Bacillaceae]MBZ9536809.1 hypothetical protein [Cytobacillus oceanisediminis]NMO75724.1 hypothetical protein [Niallia alba]UTI43521.1 hypothetical protein NKG37_07555 [Niallia sp. RD1]